MIIKHTKFYLNLCVMNNKSIKKNILKISTMCLLIGLFLFISCGSNDSGEDDKVLTKQYLSLKSYGLTDFKVTNYSEEETFLSN